jgi:5'-3' exoribonuclease 2
MNQIVHKCAESDANQPANNEEEIIKLVFKYLDRIFSIIYARRLLYMAIDGVTPRARMTHQRSNRFLELKPKSDGVMNNQDQTTTTETFDKCKIKPGTEFISKLSDCLRYYTCIYNRMNTELDWRSLKVILSDANVPDEGEHKIMEFIRRQRAKPNYDLNTHHAVYSSDSDLILLGLAAHEPHFAIIYEGCGICGKVGHDAKEYGQRNESSLTTSNNMEKNLCLFIFRYYVNAFLRN